jgi:hypothetical protein
MAITWEEFWRRVKLNQQTLDYKNLDNQQRFNLVVSGTLNRIMHYTHKYDWGIIPGFRLNISMKENLKNEWAVATRIQEMGFFYLPVITFWENTDRGLFIPKIDHDDLEQLTGEFGLSCYVIGHVEGKIWFHIYTGSKIIKEFGTQIKIIDIDDRFYQYAKIQKRKEELTSMLENIQAKDDITDCQMKKTVIGIMQKLEDLNKVENSHWQ